MPGNQVHWVGDLAMKDKNFHQAMQLVHDCTSEHNGHVTALVVLRKRKDTLMGMIPFIERDRIFLGIFNGEFIVIVDETVLNIKELIFICDNDISKYCDLSIDYNLNCFFQ